MDKGPDLLLALSAPVNVGSPSCLLHFSWYFEPLLCARRCAWPETRDKHNTRACPQGRVHDA